MYRRRRSYSTKAVAHPYSRIACSTSHVPPDCYFPNKHLIVLHIRMVPRRRLCTDPRPALAIDMVQNKVAHCRTFTLSVKRVRNRDNIGGAGGCTTTGLFSSESSRDACLSPGLFWSRRQSRGRGNPRKHITNAAWFESTKRPTNPLACILRELISVSRTLCRLTSPHAVHRLWPIHARTLACRRTAAACRSSCKREDNFLRQRRAAKVF